MLRSFSDLLGNVLDRAEEESGLDQSEFYGLAGEFLDRVYLEILGRRPWMWSRASAPFPLRVYAPVTTTANWSEGSFILSLAANLPDPVEHWRVMVDGQGYRILGRSPVPDPPRFPVMMELSRFGGALVEAPVLVYKDQYAMLEIPDVPPVPTFVSSASGGTIAPGVYRYSMTFVGSAGETVRGAESEPVTLGELSSVVLMLPGHPAGNPYAIGRSLYRSAAGPGLSNPNGVEEPPGLALRVYPGNAAEAVQVVDTTPSPLGADAPREFGDNGTVRVRLIYGVYGRGELREVDSMSEIALRERFHDPTARRWPPLAYARTSQNIITLSHQPLRDGILDIYHTEIGKPLSRSTVNEIRVPPHYRHILADAALALLLEQKHSDRATIWLGRMKDHLLVMEAEDEKVKLGYDGLRRGSRQEAGR